MSSDNKASAAHEPNRDATAIDVSKMLTGEGLRDQAAALNEVLETKSRLTTQATKDMTQLLLTAVLPLFGTWVGTVLAYFFSREGFEAASRAQLQLIEQMSPMGRLRQFKVVNRMVKRVDMNVLQLTETEMNDPRAVPFSRLIDHFKDPKTTRLPILGTDDRFFCLVHRSLKDRFIALEAEASAARSEPVDLAKLTLKHLLDMANQKKATPKSSEDAEPYTTFGDLAKEAVAFVCIDRTLADAKQEMDRVKRCQDVFVTRTGARNEPVLGWLTNVEFAKAAETFV